MDQPTYPYDLLNNFNKCIDELFVQHSNTDVKIFTTALEKFPQVKPYLNTTLYDWYFGTFLNKIVTMVFQPYLYDPDFDYWQISGRYDSQSQPNLKRLSHVQLRDALWTLYHLIINDYCDPSVKDYYDLTPLEYISTTNKLLIILDQDILDFIPRFSFILRHGKSLVQFQQSFVKKWYSEYMRRRRAAVGVFESRWLEIIMNPDTAPGKRKFQKIQAHFYELANDDR